MSAARTTRRADAASQPADDRFRAWELLPALIVVGVLIFFCAHALADPSAMDLRGYYPGAAASWQHGDPWLANSTNLAGLQWVATPFTALVLGPVTRMLTITQVAWLLTVLNLVLSLTLAGAALIWTRRRAAPIVAWLVVIALTVWGPLASTIWWKQVNLISLACAIGGWLLLRRGRTRWAAFLIGAGIAFKPLLVLYPVLLLFHRDVRRVAIGALVWFTALTIAGLAYLAWRAQTLSAADPFEYLHRLSQRTADPSGPLVCSRANISPTGTACTLVGRNDFTTSRIFIALALIAVVALAVEALRRAPGRSFAILAWAGLLSPMLSPVEWTHYEVMFAPMLLLLAVQFWRHRASLALWYALAVGYVLTQLVWSPEMSLPSQVRTWFGGPADTIPQYIHFIEISGVAQYVLIAVALVWTARMTSVATVAVRGHSSSN